LVFSISIISFLARQRANAALCMALFSCQGA
jgi:hypothetical protein